MYLILGLLLPLLGTALGSAGVYFMHGELPGRVQKTLLGFASGVMIAASVWSLLIPGMEMSPGEGLVHVMPTAVGVLIGMLFLLGMDYVTPHLHIDNKAEGPRGGKLSRTTKLVLAVAIHKIPEGMAVGVTLAAGLDDHSLVTMAGALALAIGIAIQNVPEGAIVAMPLRAAGNSKNRSFMLGLLTGVIEIAAIVATMFIVASVLSILPYLLAFAAGAMLYVVVEELIPETAEGTHSNLGTVGFAVGFVLMMILDVVLG